MPCAAVHKQCFRIKRKSESSGSMGKVSKKKNRSRSDMTLSSRRASLASASRRAERLVDKSWNDVAAMLSDHSADVRLVGAIIAQERDAHARGERVKMRRQLVESLRTERNETVCWQLAIAMSRFIESDPGVIWRLIRSYSTSRTPFKMEIAATVWLEHLLDQYPAMVDGVTKAARRSHAIDAVLKMSWHGSVQGPDKGSAR